MGWTDRLMDWLAPAPYQPSGNDWVPPALSAAATAPPATVSDAKLAPEPPSWHDKAWLYYRHNGEARRAVDWIAHGVSRCRLHIAEVDNDGIGDPTPVETPGPAGEVLAELHDGQVGQSAMMKRIATHLLVSGESWLVGYPRPKDPTATADTGSTAWVVLARGEWQLARDEVWLRLPEHPKLDEQGWVQFPASRVVMVRVYDPDPADGTRATSPFEAALAPLEELDGLDARVQADIQSRLAGAGLYELPESATMPQPQQSEAIGHNPTNGNPLVSGILAAAKTAIKKPKSASAVVPIFYTVADEAAGKGRHITFSTPFDAQVPVLRQDARKRLSSILDIPGEVIQGIEDLNHWSAWQTDSSAIKSHIGPLLTLICTTLTRKVLWPALKAAGQSPEEFRKLVIWWDASEITLRPDRTKEALDAHKQKIISDKAARRELGFGEEDAPDEELVADQKAEAEQDDQNEAQDGQQQSRQDRGGQPTPADRPEPPQGDSGGKTGPRAPTRPQRTPPR